MQDKKAGRPRPIPGESALARTLDPFIPKIKMEGERRFNEGWVGLGKVPGKAAVSKAAEGRNPRVQGDISFNPPMTEDRALGGASES